MSDRSPGAVPPPRPREVLQLLGPSAGGIRRHVATLAAGLVDRGITSPVVGPPGVMDGVGPQAGDLAVPGGLRPDSLVRARQGLRPWRGDAEVIHAHGLKAAWTAIGGSPRRPVVLTVHNVVLDEAAGRTARAQRVLESLVLRRVDRVIALTTSMADDLSARVPADRLRIALPASAVPRPSLDRATVRASIGLGDDEPLVVCVARLHPQKDLPTLLRAWAAVHGAHPRAVLAIVGDGPDRGALESLRDQLGLGTSVRFLGRRPHAVDELAAANVVVMTSVWEGAALVLAEATQLGVPMVSTPTGLAPDLLDGDVGGTVVPFGDAGAVTAALCRMLDDPAAAAEVGRRGRVRARAVFDPVRAIDEIVAVYREVLE